MLPPGWAAGEVQQAWAWSCAAEYAVVLLERLVCFEQYLLGSCNHWRSSVGQSDQGPLRHLVALPAGPAAARVCPQPRERGGGQGFQSFVASAAGIVAQSARSPALPSKASPTHSSLVLPSTRPILFPVLYPGHRSGIDSDSRTAGRSPWPPLCVGVDSVTVALAAAFAEASQFPPNLAWSPKETQRGFWRM